MWTDDLVLSLTERWGAGFSAAEIAKEFRVSRNAVIGKVHRLGLVKDGSVDWEAVRSRRQKHLEHSRKSYSRNPRPHRQRKRRPPDSATPEFAPGGWKPAYVPLATAARHKAMKVKELETAAKHGETRSQYLARLRAQTRRRRAGERHGGNVAELQAIAAQSDVRVTKCPIGAELGWLPSYLR